MAMPMQVQTLHHYPVKGLSGQALKQVELQAGQGFPMDRVFGFARPDSGFDPDNPKPLAKTNFVVLARDAGLANIRSHFDGKTGHLALDDLSFDLETARGREAAATYLQETLGLPEAERPTLYASAPHRFTDVSVVSPQLMNAVSLINLDSVSAFADRIGQPVDPARFRGNILFSGAEAFSELDWHGRSLRLGSARIRVVMRTKRCAATEVNLHTGARDLKVPALLHRMLGHADMGIYAEVTHPGRVAPGDALTFE